MRPATASRTTRRAPSIPTGRRCRPSPPSAACATARSSRPNGDGARPFRRAVEYLPAQRGADQAAASTTLSFIRSKEHWGAAFRFGFLRVPEAGLRAHRRRHGPRLRPRFRGRASQLDVAPAPRYRAPPRSNERRRAMGVMVMALFRPKPGMDAALMACMRDHMPVLRSAGARDGSPEHDPARERRHARSRFSSGCRRRPSTPRTRTPQCWQAVGALRRLLRLRDAGRPSRGPGHVSRLRARHGLGSVRRRGRRQRPRRVVT